MKGDKIVFVGSDAEMQTWIGTGTRVLDLKGDRANRFVLDEYERAFKAVPAGERKIPEPRWRDEQSQIVHNWCGYVALSASVLHPLVLLLNHSPKFTLTAIAYPVYSPGKPVENTVGAVALYLTATVVITSYFRVRLGRRLWKAFHFSIYFAAAALFFHSLLATPDLKNEPIDWLDGGKLFIVGCLALVTAAGLLRWRHSHARTKEETPALPGVGALD